MTKSQHTPTPWRMKMTSADWRVILSPQGQEITHPRAHEDAAFIVRACNAHDALVEALELIFTGNFRGARELTPEQFAVRLQTIAQTALKLAKEG